MSRKRRSKAKRDKLTGAILFLVGIVLVAALAGGAWWLRSKKVQLDADNCPKDGGPHAIHLIIIDRSDPISGQQAQRIRQILHKERDEAAFATRFDVYTFEGDVLNELRPILRVCSTGRPQDANQLVENPEAIRKKYEDFSIALDRTVDDLLKEMTRPNSPIIESLRAASISSFGPVGSGRIPLKATLISDMVQHTPATSHFRSAADFSTLSKTSIWPSIRPDLHGAEVGIVYLLRPTAVRSGAPIQNRGHQLFWEQLMSASNGRIVGIEVM